MNIFRGDEARDHAMRRADAHSQAIAKIAFFTSMFEKLVTDAGLRRERIEQLLAEMTEERAAQQAIAPSQSAAADASRKRAA